MANLETLLGGLETAFGELVTDDELKAVKRIVINGLKEVNDNPPVLGMVVSDWWEEPSGVLKVRVLLMLADRKAGSDAAVIERTRKINAKIKQVRASDGCGGDVTKPRWDAWHVQVDGSAMFVGAMGLMTLTVDD